MAAQDTGRTVTFSGAGTTVEMIAAIAGGRASVAISPAAIAAIEAAYACLLRHTEQGQAIYGVSTGLGAAVDTKLAPSAGSGQHRIPRARAVGVGPPASVEEVRAMMAARLARFSCGYSGVSMPVVEALCAMLDRGVHPRVPMTGSIGEADLAPLAHIALVLTGEGSVEAPDGAILPGAEAMQAARIALPPFGVKDGLSLISSNAAMLGRACLLLQDAKDVFDAHLAAVALSYEGFRASLDPLDPAASRLRPAPGQARTAQALASLLCDGDLAKTGAARRLQDPLSLRCVPSVGGAVWHALEQAFAATELELNSGDDNPSVLVAEDRVLPTGNFDPTHLALACDTLLLAFARLAAMAAERIMKLLSSDFSDLPRFLAPAEPGSAGFATVQKTVAALAAEIGHLAMPMPFAVTPVAGRVEDYASMSMSIIDKAIRLMEKFRYLTAIELIVAARAVDLRAPVLLGKGAQAVFERVREVVAPLDADRSSSSDIEALASLIRDGAVVAPLFGAGRE